MIQINEKPEVQNAGQTGLQDDTEPEVPLDEVELKAPDAGMKEMFLMIEFQIWRAKRLAVRQDKRYQARERLRQARENEDRPGRGKSTFVISVPTMAKIVKHIKSLHTRSSREVCRILILMYKYGKDFSKTRPKVNRRTAKRYLLAAFRDLEISTGVRKEPSLWTLGTSHNLLRDAKIAGVDLEAEQFLIV